MDDTNDVTSDDTEETVPTGQGGPLSQLAEKQPVASATPEETEETAAGAPATGPPSTGRADYASGTAEHDDDREV